MSNYSLVCFVLWVGRVLLGCIRVDSGTGRLPTASSSAQRWLNAAAAAGATAVAGVKGTGSDLLSTYFRLTFDLLPAYFGLTFDLNLYNLHIFYHTDTDGHTDTHGGWTLGNFRPRG